MRIYLFTFRQQFIQFDLTANASQCCLGELRCCIEKVFHFYDSIIGFHNPEVNHRIYLYGNIILGDHILRRNIHGNNPHINLDHPIDYGNQDDEAGTLCSDYPPQTKYYTPLIFIEYSNCCRQKQNDQNYNGNCCIHCIASLISNRFFYLYFESLHTDHLDLISLFNHFST